MSAYMHSPGPTITFWHVTHATGIGSSQRIEIKEEKRKGATVTNI